MQTSALEDEDLEAQVDRLNSVIARTLEEAQRAVHESEHSRRPTEESVTSYGPDDALFSESGYYSESAYNAEDDFHEYVEALVLQMERLQMMLEDCRAEMLQGRVLVRD